MTLPSFPSIDPDRRAELLTPPRGPVRLVLDTDTANEIDDQFALAWALLSPERIDLLAVHAEPFSFAHHRPQLLEARAIGERGGPRSDHEVDLIDRYQGWLDDLDRAGVAVEDLAFTSVSEGQELSYDEIHRVFTAAAIDPGDRVKRGATRYMDHPTDAVSSEAVDDLIRIARSADDVVYVAAIGCVTNVASALLLAPDIVDKIVVLWTSGYPTRDPRSNATSLNLVQDGHAARVLLESGVPYVYHPGFLIAEQLRLSLPEMEAWFEAAGPLGALLTDLYRNNPLYPMHGITDHVGRSWVIWDIITIAWLLNPDWVPTIEVATPSLGEDLRWDRSGHGPDRHVMLESIGVQRDAIFRDLLTKLRR